MKTVVYIISTLKRTGPVNILFDIIKYLDRSRYKPVIITLSPEEGNSRYNDFLALDVTIKTQTVSRSLAAGKDLRALKKMMSELKPAAIHTIGFRADVLGRLCLKKYYKVSSQLNYPFDDYVMTYGKLKGGIMASLTVWSLRSFNHAITCAQDVAEKLSRKGLKMEVVYNSIDTALFQPADIEEKNALRREMNIPLASAHVFIFVGVLSDRKQPLVTLKAFVEYKKKYADAFLVVLGNGPLKEECQQLVSDIKDHVIFAGNVPDTRPWLKVSDYYIATSKAEGMPVSVLEALALKIPVVLSDINPHQEILSFNPAAGRLAPVGDVAATLQAMTAISEAKLEDAGNAALAIIDKHLNARKMSGAYQEYYP